MKLLDNLDKVHTTELGLIRIEKNLGVKDGVNYCKKILLYPETNIIKKGKNYYCENNDVIITINASSYTIITAKRK